MSSRTRHNVSPWWLVEGGELVISGKGPVGQLVVQDSGLEMRPGVPGMGTSLR